MTGQLCLKWNNHSIAFNRLLNNIFLEDVYSDATILCHGKFYPVHQIVLSTCSEYFEEMFKQCANKKNKFPFIVVKDINPMEMESLLNYMYKGEVNVPQEQLPELIKAAEAFKIKGLAVPDEEVPVPPPSKKKRLSAISPISVPKKYKRNEETNKDASSSHSFQACSDTNDQSLVNFIGIKPEPIDYEISKIEEENEVTESDGCSAIKKEYTECLTDKECVEVLDFDAQADNNEEYDTGTSNLYDDDVQEHSSWDGLPSSNIGEENQESTNNREETNLFSINEEITGDQTLAKYCNYPGCNFVSGFPSTFEAHQRVHTGEKPFKCPHCPHRTSFKSNMTSHMRTIHMNEKPFQCPDCPYKAARRNVLKVHVMTKHKSHEMRNITNDVIM